MNNWIRRLPPEMGTFTFEQSDGDIKKIPAETPAVIAEDDSLSTLGGVKDHSSLQHRSSRPRY